ncbi:hypothetical protein EVAR_71628_1 [Eumeta japonica]|uniref:Uncharacterized protein n=1 Tax=Eumeta variegata TaxID=151549 RepID=A0A4C2A709_EUMVA|nr:hypothetical protein EVAR_71628_1 [Eumeta japonica]
MLTLIYQLSVHAVCSGGCMDHNCVSLRVMLEIIPQTYLCVPGSHARRGARADTLTMGPRPGSLIDIKDEMILYFHAAGAACELCIFGKQTDSKLGPEFESKAAPGLKLEA